MATMATLSVPVALISKDTQCTKILEVTTDGMSTLSDFQRQLSVGLLRNGKLLEDIRFRGNTLVGDGRLRE